MEWVKWFVICIVAVEAITEILVDSKLFMPFRTWVSSKAYPLNEPPPIGLGRIWVWFNDLISCGYCTSVWIAMSLSHVVPSPYLTWSILGFFQWVVVTAAVHRGSNWLHVFYELVRRGRVRNFDLTVQTRGYDDAV